MTRRAAVDRRAGSAGDERDDGRRDHDRDRLRRDLVGIGATTTSATTEPSTTDHAIRRRRDRFVNRRTSWRSYLRRSLLAAASSRLAALALFCVAGAVPESPAASVG